MSVTDELVAGDLRAETSKCVRNLLECLVPEHRLGGPHLFDTPSRVAAMWADELLRGYAEDPSAHLRVQFLSPGDQMVIVSPIPVYSVCAHHMVPFVGEAHIGYVPSETIAGLSKFVRLVDGYARRLQTQEDLTVEIIRAIEDRLRPQGCGVALDCQHLCTCIRGALAPNTRMKTQAFRGVMLDREAARAEFFSQIGHT